MRPLESSPTGSDFPLRLILVQAGRTAPRSEQCSPTLAPLHWLSAMLRRGTQPTLARPGVIFVRQLLGQKLRLFPALAPVRNFQEPNRSRANRRNEAELSCWVINLSPRSSRPTVIRGFFRTRNYRCGNLPRGGSLSKWAGSQRFALPWGVGSDRRPFLFYAWLVLR